MIDRFNSLRGLLFGMLFCAGTASAATYDPVAQDPPVIDKAHPPASAELKIPIADTRVNGVIYLAQGAQKHPLAIMLHGYPGNERNLDLAQALRRAGYDALYFNYRGSWGSGGKFSFASAREDVAAVLRYARSAQIADKFRIDTDRIVLVGHGMGGWLALAGAGDDAKVQCTVALAPWNIGRFGAMQSDADHRALDGFLEESRTYTDAEAGPLRGTSAEALAAEAKAHALDWDFRALAAPLAAKHGLVITSSKDVASSAEMLPAPLQQALHDAHATHWQFRMFEDDHGMSAHRIELAHQVIDWLQTDCATAR